MFGAEVADSAFGYILNLARGHMIIDASIRRGEWPKFEGITLANSRLGIVGYGAIGREIARRGLGFGMDVVAFDPFAAPESAGASSLSSTLCCRAADLLSWPAH